MVKLKIEGKTYKMASDWSEVTIKQYVEIQQIIKGEDKSELIRLVKFISVLSGVELDLLMNINLEDFQQIDISWLLEPIKPQIKNIIVIDGKRYGMIKDMKKLSLGEYVDLDHLITDVDNNLHKVCAILCRLIVQEDGELYIIEKYDGNNIEERAKLFYEKMNIVQLSSVTNFFLGSVNGL